MMALEILLYPIRLIVLFIICFYKLCVSFSKGFHCPFYPSCSSYAIIAINEWGLIIGLKLAINRILKCNPKNHGCIDYVPINIQGKLKWMF